MIMALAEIRNVTLSRGPRTILDNISFEVGASEFVAIIGPNGAGKSTLLNIMAGALTPQSGTVLFDGKPLAAWRKGEIALRRAVLAQSTQLAFPFTVDETLRLSVPDKARRADLVLHCNRAMSETGTTAFGSRIAQELSGGELQRVHLARVLVQLWSSGSKAPQMLFLDEPVSGLDLKHQLSTMKLVRSLVGESLGAVAVVHDMNLALRFATRVICIADGTIASDGTPENSLTPQLLEHVFDIPMTKFRSNSGALIIAPS
jgi:iron complex transport system ATP-binding protein